MFNKFKTTTLAAVAAAAALNITPAHALSIYDGTNGIELTTNIAPVFFGGELGTGDCVSQRRGPWRGPMPDDPFFGPGATNDGAYDVSLIVRGAVISRVEAGLYDDGRWMSSPVSAIDASLIAFCAGVPLAEIINFQPLGAGGPSATDAGAFFGFTFEHDGFLYRFGVTDNEFVDTRTPITPPDNEAPTVSLSSTTTTLTGTDPFTVTATFSEDVTGFEEADVTVTNGSVVLGSLTGGPAVYTFLVEPTGNGDVTIRVLENVARDQPDQPAGNPNTESNLLEIGNQIVEITQEAIAGFMLGRANNLASNQPGLTRFLQGDGCSAFSANATEGSGSISGCVSQGNTWAEITGAWSGDDSYTLGTFGAHSFINPNLLVGGMLQFDHAEDSANNASGNGYMVGPYFVAQVPDQPLFFEGRLLYGQTDNDISPLGTYTDSFETERWLAQLRATGEYQYQATTLMPLLDFTYTDDTQKAYTDSLGNTIPGQTVSLMQVSAGMDFSTPISVATGALELTGGLSGIYSATDGGAAAPEFENLRGRTHLGLNYGMASGVNLSATTFYDGIGTDYEGYGASLGFDVKF